MKQFYGCLLIGLWLTLGSADAQKKPSPRSLLQQRYLIDAFITPQLKKGGLKITRTSQIDSVFRAWENGWREISADSMANNPTQLTKDEFNNLDAYCYFWGLASLTQNLDVGDQYGSILVSGYMIPSLRRDLALIRRMPVPEIVENLDLANTLAIGTAPAIDRETFLQTYALYKDYNQFYHELALRPDTAVSKAAKKMLPTLDRVYYAMNARYNFYQGNMDEAFTYLVTGLNVDRFSKSRAIALTKKLNEHYVKAGENEKALALLNTLAINTTPDNLNRDTLAAWYTSADHVNGPKTYANLKSKLSGTSFKTFGNPLKLPDNWAFLANAIPPEKMAKAKYILVDFWYTGCGPCLAEIPGLNKFYAQIKERSDVVFISINTDYENGKQTPGYVTQKSKELGINYPVYYDSIALALNHQAGITGYPSKLIWTVNGQQLIKNNQSLITVDSFRQLMSENK